MGFQEKTQVMSRRSFLLENKKKGIVFSMREQRGEAAAAALNL